MSPRLLVFGSSGQVAQELNKIGVSLDFEVVLAGRETIDLLTEDGGEFIARVSPSAVVNAAAYTAVDRAEQEPSAAFRLNRDAPGLLAGHCSARDIPFVHISTDYVFDGAKPLAYAEDDPRHPLGVYGESKSQGEDAVAAAGGRYAILRTAWVYSSTGSNFVKTMLRLAAQRDTVAVVADQHGCPTWAQDVAQAALLLARRMISGDLGAAAVFHAVGAGEATWADLAEAVFEESARRGGPCARVDRITTAGYPTPARRPVNSRLSCLRLAATVGWTPGPWTSSLSACMDEIYGPPDPASAT